MTTTVFVHGINVRRADFQRIYDVVLRQVNGKREFHPTFQS